MRWPDGHPPIVDGNFWEWEWEGMKEYTVPFSAHWYGAGIELTEDFEDYNSSIAVGWNEAFNRIYLYEVRRDNEFVPWDSGSIFLDADIFSVSFDGDHGGEDIWQAEESNSGRWAQNYLLALPQSTGIDSVGFWAYSWTNQAAWSQHWEYMEMAWAYTEEGYLKIESSWTLWDDFLWDNPEGSIETDLEPGNIIHIGWSHWDYDTVPGTGGHVEFYIFGPEDPGAIEWKQSALMDFLLEPERGLDPPGNSLENVSSIGATTWGRIKHSFAMRRWN